MLYKSNSTIQTKVKVSEVSMSQTPRKIHKKKEHLSCKNLDSTGYCLKCNRICPAVKNLH